MLCDAVKTVNRPIMRILTISLIFLKSKSGNVINQFKCGIALHTYADEMAKCVESFHRSHEFETNDLNMYAYHYITYRLVLFFDTARSNEEDQSSVIEISPA